METKRKGRPTNGTHVCKCCQIEFQTAKEKCTHESNKRIQDKGHAKKRFKTSESMATPSIDGSFFGTKDTNMNDLMFDIPNTK